MGRGALSCGKLLVVLCVLLRGVVLGGTLSSDGSDRDGPATCAGVAPIFQMKNISVDVPDAPISGLDLAVCVSSWSCCTRQMEAGLQRQVRRDFQALLHHNSRSLQGLLVSAANTIREHVLWQLQQSESRARSLIAQLLGGLAATPRDPMSALYGRLAAHLEAPLQPQSQQTAPVEGAVAELWRRLVPLAYQRSAGHRLAGEYRACLRRAAAQLRLPQGPRRLAVELQRALEAARVLRQALLRGAAVLNATDALLTGEAGSGPAGGAVAQAQCHTALLRMSYCSRCHGLHRDVRPCAGLCLNVLRGCLTQHAAELDLPWNGYVEAAERLVVAVQGHGAVDDVLRSLDGRIADAVMAAVEQSTSFQQQVKRVCGPHMWDYGVADEDAATADDGTAPQDSVTGADGERLSSKLQPFLASLRKSRGFYANLAESLCSDESFAETRDTADCWNGQRVGEYTKTVVAASPVAQKYNPELRWLPAAPDARVAELSDQLRHLKQVLASQLTEAPSALSLVRYAEEEQEGEGEGSGGGGQSPGDWDAEPGGDSDREEGSGSGDRPVVVGGDTLSTDNTIYPSSEEDSDKHGIGTSSKRRPENALLVICSVLLTSHILCVANM